MKATSVEGVVPRLFEGKTQVSTNLTYSVRDLGYFLVASN